jgi:nucleoside-diphosphate-sugar epimerase
MGTVLVLGGSSQIGHFLLPRLRAAGHEVIAVSREVKSDTDGVSWRRGRLPDAMPLLPPLHAIVSFGPIVAFAEWLADAGIEGEPHIVATSSMSAQSKRESPVDTERETSQQLRDGEIALSAACERHGLPWTVLRPTLVYGAGLDKSLTPIARRATRLRVFALPAGRGLRQPVHADDIAQATLAAIGNRRAAGRIFEIGGGERITATEMFARVRRSLPVATLPMAVPGWLLATAARLLPRLRGPVFRLDSDLIADNSGTEEILGVHPRAFRVDPSSWRNDAR